MLARSCARHDLAMLTTDGDFQLMASTAKPTIWGA
jgi:hypothetical protein